MLDGLGEGRGGRCQRRESRCQEEGGRKEQREGREGERKRAEIERDPEIKLERNNKMEKGRREGGRVREKKRDKWIWGMGRNIDQEKWDGRKVNLCT